MFKDKYKGTTNQKTENQSNRNNRNILLLMSDEGMF